MTRAQFLIRQCSNQHCRFRFPAPVSQAFSPFCPKCGHKLLLLNKSFSNVVLSPECKPGRGFRLSILLDNVRSAMNVGSIIRTAEGIGVEEIHLCGITPTPDNPKVGKSALSADANMKWHYHLNAVDAVRKLIKAGHLIWSLEITENSIPMQKAIKQITDKPMILVAGNEQAGVDPAILAISHQTVHLPMYGMKSSLNIAVAVGITAFLLLSSS